jgi:hypothetical protein
MRQIRQPENKQQRKVRRQHLRQQQARAGKTEQQATRNCMMSSVSGKAAASNKCVSPSAMSDCC